MKPGNVHDLKTCRVRGCPLILPHDALTEWGSDQFIVASSAGSTKVPEHEHFPLQLSFPISGSWFHSFGQKQSAVLTQGDAAFIPSGERHGYSGVHEGEVITINAELDWCEENCDLSLSALRRVGNDKCKTVGVRPLQGMLRHASGLLRAEARDDLYIGSVGLTATLGVLHELGLRSRCNPSLTSPKPLKQLVRWIDDHLEEKLTLSTLASIANCSSWHVIRLFTAYLKTSPGRYVAEQRLERSRKLLCAPGSDIADVALQCGFSSQSHFTRVFARRYGEPPGVFRAKRGFAARLLPRH